MKYLGTFRKVQDNIGIEENSWYLIHAECPSRITTIGRIIEYFSYELTDDGKLKMSYFITAYRTSGSRYLLEKTYNRKVKKEYHELGIICDGDLIFELSHDEILKHIVANSL